MERRKNPPEGTRSCGRGTPEARKITQTTLACGDLVEHAEEVGAEDLLDVARGVASLQQALGDPWKVGHVVEALRSGQVGHVQVRAEPDVLDSSDLYHPVDLVEEALEGRAGNVTHCMAVKTLARHTI